MKSRKEQGYLLSLVHGETVSFEPLHSGKLGRHHQETSICVHLGDRDGTQMQMSEVTKERDVGAGASSLWGHGIGGRAASYLCVSHILQ